MRRLLPIVLTGFILLTQLGLVLHTYQDHNSNEVCHLCLASSQSDHALVSSPITLSVAGSFSLQAHLPQHPVTQQTVQQYAARAPPRFL